MDRLQAYNQINSIASDEEGNLKNTLPEVNELLINLGQIKHNYDIIRGLLKPNTKFMAILKGNAYGHGMIPVAKELEHWGCDALGVVRLNEAFALREAGIKLPIYQLAPFLPNQAPWILRYNITPMIDQELHLEALEKSCEELNTNVNIHIKVNTGLNRYGIDTAHVLEFMRMIPLKYSRLNVEGMYTHLQNPDYNPSFTLEQIRQFQKTIRSLEKENLRPSIVHAGSSAAILKYPQAHFDLVRCGVLLFGLEHTEGEKDFPDGVASAISLKGKILKIREIKSGEFGGYGTAFLPDKNTYVAIISLGYGDGISRGWKDALIGGKRVPIVSFFMDGIMVDITKIREKVNLYDEAVLIGSQGSESIHWGEVCKSLGTYEDEQIQYLAERIPKKYCYCDNN